MTLEDKITETTMDGLRKAGLETSPILEELIRAIYKAGYAQGQRDARNSNVLTHSFQKHI